jgi:hypothetical protein
MRTREQRTGERGEQGRDEHHPQCAGVAERGFGGDLADDEDRDGGRQVAPRADEQTEEQRRCEPAERE